MGRFKLLLLLVAASVLVGCKIIIVVPAGGVVTDATGQVLCFDGQRCEIEVSDFDFSQLFIA